MSVYVPRNCINLKISVSRTSYISGTIIHQNAANFWARELSEIGCFWGHRSSKWSWFIFEVRYLLSDEVYESPKWWTYPLYRKVQRRRSWMSSSGNVVNGIMFWDIVNHYFKIENLVFTLIYQEKKMRRTWLR